MGNNKLVFSIVFGILALGILSNQLVFAEPGEDTSPSTSALPNIAVATGLDPVEPDASVGTTFFGNGGYSADGASANPNGVLLAEVPPGSTVEQVYLYSTTSNSGSSTVTVNFDGTQYVLDQLSNSSYDGCCNLKAFKHTSPALVSQVSAKIGGGSNSQFSFNFTEISPFTTTVDGVGLVIIFSNPAFPENSIAILDGGLATSGDTTIVGLAKPLDKTVDGFSATMSLGIGFSFSGSGNTCGSGQVSTVDVNGQRLTSCAGSFDDGHSANGGLFTIGGVNDDTNNPPNPLGSGGEDDELYDVSGFLNQGDTKIEIDTKNASSDDIVFLAIIQLTAQASIGEICGDGVDNDNDSLIDEGCAVSAPPATCVDYDFNVDLEEQETASASTFDSDLSNFSGVVNFEDVQGYTADGFDGKFLRNPSIPALKTTLTLTELPAHVSVDVGFLLAIIDSWDGSDGSPSPDIFNVDVDGESIFSETFANFSGTGSYAPSEGVEIAHKQQRGFGIYDDSSYNMANEPMFQNINHTSSSLTIDWFASGEGYQGTLNESWAIDNLQVCVNTAESPVTQKSNGGDNQWDTRPTFGVSHETRQEVVVGNGFGFNNEHFTLTDNHHTDFPEQLVDIGAVNSFSATVYADKQLKVQEFLFGIPNVGESHLAELGVEVWYDFNGEIEDVRVVQRSDVIDAETVSVTHEKVKCLSNDNEAKCDNTTVSMTFLEPLKDKVMAIKAIDFKNRDQRTYLNDGFDISGESLNPMSSKMIPSTVKDEGLVSVSQVAKYSPYWATEDGRMFEMNSFGSFKQIDQSFERFQDTGNAFTRAHSAFGGILQYEKTRAIEVFDSTKLISELPDSFGHHIVIQERMTEEMKQEILLQQEIAREILEEMNKQDRHY